MNTEGFNRDKVFSRINIANYTFMNALLNESSDEDVLQATEDLITDLLEMIPFYEMKEFRITLMNSFRM